MLKFEFNNQQKLNTNYQVQTHGLIGSGQTHREFVNAFAHQCLSVRML